MWFYIGSYRYMHYYRFESYNTLKKERHRLIQSHFSEYKVSITSIFINFPEKIFPFINVDFVGKNTWFCDSDGVSQIIIWNKLYERKSRGFIGNNFCTRLYVICTYYATLSNA